MKRSRIYIALLILLLCLSFVLSACDDNAANTDTPTSNVTSQKATSTETSSTEASSVESSSTEEATTEKPEPDGTIKLPFIPF